MLTHALQTRVLGNEMRNYFQISISTNRKKALFM